MVSQPSMRRIFGLPTCLVGLTAGLLIFTACGQNAGGRCQIDSDCASGLQCIDGQSGNGTCQSQAVVVTQNDAAVKDDVAEAEVATPPTAEVGSEAEPTPALDADTVDTGAVD
jgi:hypothetical protein